MITIVTIYRENSCEHYLGAIQGKLTEEQRQSLANMYKCERVSYDNEDDEDIDYIFFREVEVATDFTELKNVYNIDGETYPATNKETK